MYWLSIVGHIPKNQRYTIGIKIEEKFLELLEQSYTAYFTEKSVRGAKLTECILLLDTLKFLVHVAWEAKFISHKHYEELGVTLNELGKMFGGWRKSLENPEKKNRAL